MVDEVKVMQITDQGLKGKEFTELDLPSRATAGPRALTPEEIEAWCAKQTERYRVVAIDEENGRHIIAEELNQRVLNTLSTKARRQAGAILMLDAATRREILSAFDQDGNLKIPFKMV